MVYPTVKKGHVVPRVYLRGFAAGEKLVVRLVADDSSHLTSLKKAGTRGSFYRRTRPDGSQIDDVEASLSHVEDAAGPILRTAEESWPLSLDDKATMAEFLGVQYLRGVRWRRFHEQQVKRQIDDWRSGRADPPTSRPPTAEELDRTEEHLLTDTQVLVRMLSLIPKAKSLFGSMHWSLVTFDGSALALSDEPVVLWPSEDGGQRPTPGVDRVGLTRVREVLAPLTASSALLMTWLDEPDRAQRLAGRRHHAETLNAFVVGQADTQWFHAPDARPKIGAGQRLPISSELYPGYSATTANASRRRAKIAASVQSRLGETLGSDAELVTVSP